MQQVSPFGQFAPIIASLAGLAILAAYLFAVITDNASAVSNLQDLVWLAVGTILGGATAIPAINGHVASQVAANAKRLDALGAPAAGAIPDPVK